MVHTHGLGAIGRFDFDMLRPFPDLWGRGADAVRAIACAKLEGAVDRCTARYALAYPGGNMRFVDVEIFDWHAAEEVRGLRGKSDDDSLSRDRAGICEPRGRWLGRWRKKVEPSHFLSARMPEGAVFAFPASATELMAERIRKTYGVLRRIAGELSGFEFPILVKMGYVVDVAPRRTARISGSPWTAFTTRELTPRL